MTDKQILPRHTVPITDPLWDRLTAFKLITPMYSDKPFNYMVHDLLGKAIDAKALELQNELE